MGHIYTTDIIYCLLLIYDSLNLAALQREQKLEGRIQTSPSSEPDQCDWHINSAPAFQ